MQFKESSIDGKDFVKLKDGDSISGVFRGDPYDFKQHWGEGHPTRCTGEACPLCKEGKKPTSRFRLNFVVTENGALAAKIFEQGWKVYKTLRALHADYDLEKTFVKITRSGSGKNDTEYAVLPLKNGDVTKEQEAKISFVKLHDLANPGSEAVTENDEDQVPF